jgi:hypothetical protein
MFNIEPINNNGKGLAFKGRSFSSNKQQQDPRETEFKEILAAATEELDKEDMFITISNLEKVSIEITRVSEHIKQLSKHIPNIRMQSVTASRILETIRESLTGEMSRMLMATTKEIRAEEYITCSTCKRINHVSSRDYIMGHAKCENCKSTL